VLLGALVIGALAALVFMRPTLVAPVAGDDRNLYPSMGAYDDSWTPLSDLARVPEWWEVRSEKGRVNLVTVFERRTAARAIVETSVVTSTPTYLVNGAVKLLLTLASVFTLTALIRSLRWRRGDGALVRLSGGTVLLCTLAGGVLGHNGRNAWVNYPTHTYGAVVSIFGVVALVLWLTRLYAEGRHRVPIIVTLVLLALVTNFRYELVFSAVPLAVIALLLVPVTPGDRVAEGRRAKWVTGLAYAGVFLPVLVVLRWYLRGICESGSCYKGVTISLSSELPRTFWLNVVSGVPGLGTKPATNFVDLSGISTRGMYTPTTTSLLVALGLALALLLCWWFTRPSSLPPLSASSRALDDDVARGPDEARILAIGAGLCLLGALGAAGLMSLSEAAQVGMKLGQLYRHTVVAWAGMAWAVVLAVLALGSCWRRVGAVAWVALTLTTAILAAVQLPANERSLAADRAVNSPTASAFDALRRGDLSSGANTYRCRLEQKMLLEPSSKDGASNTVDAFNNAFRRYWGQDFCQT
jgi:hypothetical protein